MTVAKKPSVLMVIVVIICCASPGERIMIIDAGHERTEIAKTWSGLCARGDDYYVVVTGVADGSTIIDGEKHLAAFLRYRRADLRAEFMPESSWILFVGQAIEEAQCNPVTGLGPNLYATAKVPRLDGHFQCNSIEPTNVPSEHCTVSFQGIVLERAGADAVIRSVPDHLFARCARAEKWRLELSDP